MSSQLRHTTLKGVIYAYLLFGNGTALQICSEKVEIEFSGL